MLNLRKNTKRSYKTFIDQIMFLSKRHSTKNIRKILKKSYPKNSLPSVDVS